MVIPGSEGFVIGQITTIYNIAIRQCPGQLPETLRNRRAHIIGHRKEKLSVCASSVSHACGRTTSRGLKGGSAWNIAVLCLEFERKKLRQLLTPATVCDHKAWNRRCA